MPFLLYSFLINELMQTSFDNGTFILVAVLVNRFENVKWIHHASHVCSSNYKKLSGIEDGRSYFSCYKHLLLVSKNPSEQNETQNLVSWSYLVLLLRCVGDC